MTLIKINMNLTEFNPGHIYFLQSQVFLGIVVVFDKWKLRAPN